MDKWETFPLWNVFIGGFCVAISQIGGILGEGLMRYLPLFMFLLGFGLMLYVFQRTTFSVQDELHTRPSDSDDNIGLESMSELDAEVNKKR